MKFAIKHLKIVFYSTCISTRSTCPRDIILGDIIGFTTTPLQAFEFFSPHFSHSELYSLTCSTVTLANLAAIPSALFHDQDVPTQYEFHVQYQTTLHLV